MSFYFKAEYYSTVGIDHILFIHLSFNELLNYFLLVIVNNAAINLNVQMSEPLLLTLLGIYPEVELMDYMGNSMFCFNLLRITITFKCGK